MSKAAQKQLQGSERPVAQPTYILRGHASAIHTLAFLRSNLWLLSGDADGWVVIWSTTTKRPVAVWRAHEAAILGAEPWGDDKVITHGRDGKLRVWALSGADEGSMSTELPVEEHIPDRKQPWLYHAIDVPTLTFCSFSSCEVEKADGEQEREKLEGPGDDSTDNGRMFIAVPGSVDSSIEIYCLPSEKQMALIPAPDQTDGKTGMVMALRLFYKADSTLVTIAGYESGRTYVFEQVLSAKQWRPLYTSRPHSQPILSLDISPTFESYFTSGADAIIAKHPLNLDSQDDGPLKEVQTRHAGQQGLHVRSDAKIFATAGWDARVRVYSVKTMRELAVLKWHKEGCYAIALADIQDRKAELISENDEHPENQLLPHHNAVSRNTPVQQARETRARFTHWLAAGSKDGKVSLWDIY